MCREEAKNLSALKPQLAAANIKLYAVVHENLGVTEFKDFFDGEVFLDNEKRFYGPKERWLPIWHGFLRFDTFAHAIRAQSGGVKGNIMTGEGRLLGGVFMFASGDQGIMFEHFERSWGDHASITDITAAIDRAKRS